MDSGHFKKNGIQRTVNRNFGPTRKPSLFGGGIMHINTYSVHRSSALPSSSKGKREEHGLAVRRTKPGQHPVQCGRRNNLPYKRLTFGSQMGVPNRGRCFSNSRG